jgi:uncharacterized protein
VTLSVIAVLATAGFAAGAINTLIGGGALIALPAMLLLGFAPVVANMTVVAGLVPGAAAGAYAYRRQLPRAAEIAPGAVAVVAGGAAGALTVSLMPAVTFAAVVPFFVAAAVILIMLPRPARAPAAGGLRFVRAGPVTRAIYDPGPARPPAQRWAVPALAAMFAAGAYGGYFSAGSGIIYLAVLAGCTTWGMQQSMAAKNIYMAAVLTVAAVLYATEAHIAWAAAVPIAAGSLAGGPAGAWAGQRMSPAWVKVIVGGLGAATIVHQLGA